MGTPSKVGQSAFGDIFNQLGLFNVIDHYYHLAAGSKGQKKLEHFSANYHLLDFLQYSVQYARLK
jgi:hypothetical protein